MWGYFNYRSPLMPLLSVESKSKNSEEFRSQVKNSLTQAINGFTYGENVDMMLLEVGRTTGRNGFIYEIHHVFTLNEGMLSTFRHLLTDENVEDFEQDIDFENNLIRFTVFFCDTVQVNKRGCYMYKALFSLNNPCLYYGLLCIWNPTRYLSFL